MTLRMITILFASLVIIPAQAQDKQPAKPRYETRKDHDPNGIGKFYMNREIAQVMGHLGIDWLERPEREEEEQPAKLMKALDIKPGMTVCDLGAGSGYFTWRLSKLVGDKGTVLAVDIQPEMLEFLDKQAKIRNVSNVKMILGTETDPKLPANTVDLILLVDVYHEFNYPYEMTEAMVKSLKVGGKIVFVEYRAEDAWVPIKAVHKMYERQVLLEMEPFPLKHKGTSKVLPRQHIIFMEKEAPKK